MEIGTLADRLPPGRRSASSAWRRWSPGTSAGQPGRAPPAAAQRAACLRLRSRDQGEPARRRPAGDAGRDGPDLPLPGHGAGRQAPSTCTLRRATLRVRHRAGRGGQDDAAAGPPGPAAPPGRGCVLLERPAGGGPACSASAPRAPTPRRCPPVQRARCGTTSCAGCRGRARPTSPAALRLAVLEPDVAAWSGGWRRWSGRGGCASPGARCSAPRRRGCWCGSRSCWWWTTSPAPWTWRRRRRCGTACWATGLGHRAPVRMGYRRADAQCWPSPTGAPSWSGPTR